MEKRKIKVLLAKANIDGHWWGPLAVVTALRDAGMEVIYLDQVGPSGIAETAIQEGVDVIGFNIASTRYEAVKKVVDILREKGVKDVLMVAGGQVPREDFPELKGMGIAEVFPPGSSLNRIVDFIAKNVKQKKQ